MYNPEYFLTAYGIAVKHGYTGTEEEWNNAVNAARIAAEAAAEDAENAAATAAADVAPEIISEARTIASGYATAAGESATAAAASATAANNAKTSLEAAIAQNPGTTVVDPTLAISGAAADAAACGAIKSDLGELNNSFGFAINDISDMQTVGAFCSSLGKWNNIGSDTYRFICIKIKAKPCIVNIKAKSVFYYAGLKTYKTPVANESLDFSDSANWNGRNNGTTISDTLPNDVNYLIVWVKSSSVAIVFDSFYVGKKTDISGIELKNVDFSVKSTGGKNLLLRETETKGFTIERYGTVSSSPNYSVSDYIPTTFGDSVTFSGTQYNTSETYIVNYVNFYNDEKTLLSTIGASTGETVGNPCTINIPRNVKWFRCSYRTLNTNMQIERGSVATEYEEPVLKHVIPLDDLHMVLPKDISYMNNPWLGKKLVVDGDSISHDQGRYNYWQFIVSDLLGMNIDTTATWNFSWQGSNAGCGWRGIAGSRLANDPVDNTDDLGQSIALRCTQYADDADLIVLFGGSNDWGHGNVTLGTISGGDADSVDGTPNYDIKTWYGALNYVCYTLKNKYPTKPIVLMTPINRESGIGKPHSRTGIYQKQFVNAMKEVCEKWGVHCLDIYGSGILNPNIPSMRVLYEKEDGTCDWVHPNLLGHEVLGKRIAGFIRSIG